MKYCKCAGPDFHVTAGCKGVLDPVYYDQLRKENDDLKEENAMLRQHIERWVIDALRLR